MNYFSLQNFSGNLILPAVPTKSRAQCRKFTTFSEILGYYFRHRGHRLKGGKFAPVHVSLFVSY